ncbi:MAG TPA: transcriptional regulator [Ruminococcaceae bacterium]|nr:transcriptional regulator [Oscillospiraceae bacterium]
MKIFLKTEKSLEKSKIRFIIKSRKIVNRFTYLKSMMRRAFMPENSVTINTVARMARTSKTTVSFYLNGKFEKMSAETRGRIQKAIEATRYRPNLAARCLNRKRTKMVGVILGDVANLFANQVVRGIESVTLPENYQIVLGNSNYDGRTERIYIERMVNMGVDGLIVQPTLQFPDVGKKLKALGVPIVFLDSSARRTANSRVGTDSRTATRRAVEACLERGYDDFLMLTADPGKLSARQDRVSAFLGVLKKAGKACATLPLHSDTSPGEISAFVAGHLRLNRHTLLFVPNCWALPTVYLALRNFRNLIPNTVGVLGFDNTEWTRFSAPSVTTVVQPVYEEGREAMRILSDILSGKRKEPVARMLECAVDWGESTALRLSGATQPAAG